jgi:NTE family protein
MPPYPGVLPLQERKGMPNGKDRRPAEAAARGRGPAKRINLALQGGGSHGAFTWGVLDRLLEEPSLAIDGVCGTSAGAMNAAVLVTGDAEDGPRGARRRLARFWEEVGKVGRFGPFARTPWERLTEGWRLDHSPTYLWLDLLSRVWSPYDSWVPAENPLRPILERVVDVDLIRLVAGIKLFVCATNVRTGKVKVWGNREVSVDALLASACLPTLFRAVEVDGERYWDGGYMGNPALWPLAYESEVHDVLIVEINPLHRDEMPRSAIAIRDRMNEISFNSTLMREMRAIHFVNRLIDGGKLPADEYKRTNIHLISAPDEMTELHAASKLNAEPEFLSLLFAIGRRAADEWLAANYDRIGVASSVDVAKVYL